MRGRFPDVDALVSNGKKLFLKALYKNKVHTDLLKHHFTNRVVDQWNALPEELLDIPGVKFKLFKSKLKVHLLSHASPYD